MKTEKVINKYVKTYKKIEGLNEELSKTIEELHGLSPYPVGAVVEVVGPVHKGKNMEVFKTEFIGIDKKDGVDKYCWALKGYVLKKDGSKTSHIAESWCAYEKK